jgi:3-oxoacyl-[acyl-carrier protein] reductase
MKPGAAIVTGAGSPDGIGFWTARRLAMKGIPIVITSTTNRIQERVAELRSLGGVAVGLDADLTEPASSARLVDFALSNFAGVDILVNSAGMTSLAVPDQPASIGSITDTQWHASIARNLHTMFYMCRALLPLMCAAGYGRIVNVASVSGPLMAYGGDAGYHAAKAGTIGLTRSIAIDAAAYGVTANAVAPGWISTASASDHERRMGNATPVGRPGTPNEVASLISYLAGPDSGYITGQVLVVDGGNSIAEERGALTEAGDIGRTPRTEPLGMRVVHRWVQAAAYRAGAW